MANRITIDEHELFHTLVRKLTRAHNEGLIHSLYVDRRNYVIKALSEYGEWYVSLKPPEATK